MVITVASSSSSLQRGPLSLPLLEGLSHRHRPSESMVQEALDRWQAERILVEWLRKKHGIRGKRKHSTSHWLIRGLASSSLPERRVACQVLCQGCTLQAYRQWQLMELVVELCREVVKDDDDDACFVFLLGLLQHLIAINHATVPFLHHPRMGLKWICTSLWTSCVGKVAYTQSLTHLLHTLLSSTPDAHAMLWKQPKLLQTTLTPMPTYETILAKSSTITTAATTTTSPLSPLACLIGTYHFWKQEQKVLPKTVHKTISLLKQLIDPAYDPKQSDKTNDHADATAAKTKTTFPPSTKLMDTFGDLEKKNEKDKDQKNISSPATSRSNMNNSRDKQATSISNLLAAASGSTSPDRSAAATVARIFSAVYGSNDDRQEDDDNSNDSNDELDEEHNATDHFVEEEGLEIENDHHDDDEDDDDEDDEEEENEVHHHQAEEDGDDDNEGKSRRKKKKGDDVEDEDIDSDEGENDGGCDEDEEEDNDDDEDEDEEEDEHDIVIHDEDVARLEQGLLELNEIEEETPPRETHTTTRSAEERKKLYIKASMQILGVLHPLRSHESKPPLSLAAERYLMMSIMNIVQPPKKPLNTKMILRRAPTQEEFFRGSLSKNPVSLSMLKAEEPTVKDLRQHIADDLQMGDSAELLELLVANKIIDVDLKLRVVHQVVWKDHLLQNSSTTSSSALSSLLSGRGGARSFISTGGGLSMIFNNGLERSLVGGGGSGGAGITDETPLSALPPMIVTYRLTGVDGEATEDTVSTLQDPEAPSETASPEEVERLLENQFGITRLVTKGSRGVFCLLRSVEKNISDTLRKIRRDDIGLNGRTNPSRTHFKESTPYPGLTLLSCCSKLPSNRKMLLQSRAPTVLLRLLLDVLDALEEDGNAASESNATAKGLQELIEVLASDMFSSGLMTSVEDEGNDVEQDASTLRLLISAIETSSLSSPLRNVIAKLLPYLTYGQTSLSKELALEFVRHVSVDQLGECEKAEDHEEMIRNRSVLMATFVHASISLPANDVCDSLRSALIQCGFVEHLCNFILKDIPQQPPSWSPSLWPKGQAISDEKEKENLETQWREYCQRQGVKTAFDMLIGLSKQHPETQHFLGSFNSNPSFICACHWMESTSDNSSKQITMKGLGLVAETLLDEFAEIESSPIAQKVKTVRRETRNRKKEIAMERRSKALISMSSFGPLTGAAKASHNDPTTIRETAASLLAPVLGLFRDNAELPPPPAKRRKKESLPKEPIKPAWMAEMEDMEDEDGLTCAVCQEGRTLQPSELLGLYAYVKKVSVPPSQCGGRSSIDGTSLLTVLPLSSLPESLEDSLAAVEWYPAGKAVGEELRVSSRPSLSSSVASSRRATYFTTTVSAGNAIHFSCHTRARKADRNHPKAPKSEWEGASLRNSRVNCNVIMPLVSSRSSKVSLVAVDEALTDHQTAVSNLLGARPNSMLWNVLHDVRFLLLRMAYGEPLNADCGGGSLLSNCQLVLYQLHMADMFEKDAQMDAPETAQHARALSAGFLAASAITQADDYDKSNQTVLLRGLSDSALMASLTCILFHNTKDDYGSATDEDKPHPKRRWIMGKENFLRGLLNCAGRRHALGVENSGCLSGRNAGRSRSRSSSFAEWDIVDDGDAIMDIDSASIARESIKRDRSSSKAGIDDFRDALRPMLVYYAMMDQLSTDFVLNMDDVKVEEVANRLAQVIDNCQRSKGIHELLRKAKVTLDHDEIIDELQRGMISA